MPDAQHDAPITATEFRRELDDVKAELARQVAALSPAAPQPQSPLERFLSSGAFFILLGLCLLLASYFGLQSGVHTSFSFVLVVLGVAILLYGTGTQGIGRFVSDSAYAKYNVALAGGAGVLAIAIGFGMGKFGADIQRTFGVETRYVVAQFRPNNDGESDFAHYWPEFTIDGVPIASVRRGDKLILAFVPYQDTERDRVKRVSYILYARNPARLSPNLKSRVDGFYDLALASVKSDNSGVDFPSFDVVTPIDVRSQELNSGVRQAAGARALQTDEGKQPPTDIPPALVVAQ